MKQKDCTFMLFDAWLNLILQIPSSAKDQSKEKTKIRFCEIWALMQRMFYIV